LSDTTDEEKKMARTKPTLQEQIAEHRKAIADFTERASLCDTCGFRKSAAHWRAEIAAIQSCIRACERRMVLDGTGVNTGVQS